MNAQQAHQFEADYDKFLQNGFLFTAKDDTGQWSISEALRRLRFYTKLYVEKNNSNCSSISAFKIVADALASEKEIKPIPGSELLDEEEEPELTAEQYHAMSVRQVMLKHKSDPIFRDQVQSLIDRGLI
jgi:hypothetical protein